MEIFLGVIAVVLVLYMVSVQYKKYKARKRAEKIKAMIANTLSDIERKMNCCKELEPILRPDVVKVSKPKKAKKKAKVVKKKVSNRK